MLHPTLKEISAATPTTVIKTFLVTKRGKPFSPESFGTWFRKICDTADCPEISAHTLRKATARRLAEIDCSALQIAAITGHATLKEVERYTKTAAQAHGARGDGEADRGRMVMKKRKLVRRLGEIGYTPRQIASITGHVTLKEMDIHRMLGLAVQILEEMPEGLRPKINTKDIHAILAGEDTGRNGLIMTEAIANALVFRTQQVIDQPAAINSVNIQKLFVLFQLVQHCDAWNFAVKYIEVLDRFGRAKTEREK
jgi:hypothetical protein